MDLIGLTFGELNFHFTFRVHFKTSFPDLFSGFGGRRGNWVGEALLNSCLKFFVSYLLDNVQQKASSLP